MKPTKRKVAHLASSSTRYNQIPNAEEEGGEDFDATTYPLLTFSGLGDLDLDKCYITAYYVDSYLVVALLEDLGPNENFEEEQKAWEDYVSKAEVRFELERAKTQMSQLQDKIERLEKKL